MKTIIADYRENTDELVKILSEKYGFSIIRKQLPQGDYFIEPDITLERKTCADFGLSIIDGRLFRQAYRLAEFSDNPIFLIEGKHFPDMNISTQAISGALISLALTFRIPVLWTKDQNDTAWHIKQMYEQRQRIGQNKGAKKGYYPKKAENQKQHILKALPGVGPKIAKILYEEFGSLKNLANSELEELKKIPGLGDKKAEKIYQILREKRSNYRI